MYVPTFPQAKFITLAIMDFDYLYSVSISDCL